MTEQDIEVLRPDQGTWRRASTTSLAQWPLRMPLLANVDGDGRLDVLAASAFEGGGTLLLADDGHEGFAAPRVLSLFTPRTLAAADLDGDGQVLDRDGGRDLVTLERDFPDDGSHVSVAVRRNLGAWGSSSGGGFADPVKLPLPPQLEALVAVALGDVDGDHMLDVLVGESRGNYGGGRVAVWRGRGDGTFLAPTTLSFGYGIAAIVPLDVDGDGKDELLVYQWLHRSSDSLNDLSLIVIDSDGNPVAGLEGPGGLGATWSARPFLADLNGDGIRDLVHGSLEGVTVHYGAGHGSYPREMTQELPNVWADGAADIDGDGRIDLLAGAAVFFNRPR